MKFGLLVLDLGFAVKQAKREFQDENGDDKNLNSASNAVIRDYFLINERSF